MEQEALKLVEDLNNESWSEGNNTFWEPFEFISTGNFCGIKFMGEFVWDSENDGREYDYDKDEHKEDLRTFVIKESKKILKNLKQKIKLL